LYCNTGENLPEIIFYSWREAKREQKLHLELPLLSRLSLHFSPISAKIEKAPTSYCQKWG
jgi:hypothetical protein